jgi:hypothetical protein
MAATYSQVLTPKEIIGNDCHDAAYRIKEHEHHGRFITGRRIPLFKLTSSKRSKNMIVRQVEDLTPAETVALQHKRVTAELIRREKTLGMIAVRATNLQRLGMNIFKATRSVDPLLINGSMLTQAAAEAAAINRIIESQPRNMYLELPHLHDTSEEQGSYAARLHGFGIFPRSEQHPSPTPYLIVSTVASRARLAAPLETQHPQVFIDYE